MSRAIKRVRVRAEETGQTIVLVVVALVALLGMAGFAIDVGYAYYTHRSLQASADAAALAGAQKLPDGSASITLARQFGTSSVGKNKQGNLDSVTESITTKCISSIPGCKPHNAVVVDETTRSKTFFSKVLGIDGFDVHVRSTACSPCGSKPFDVVLVLDRTGSMCMDHWGNQDNSCADLNNAKAGMRAFLGGLDSQSTMVGLTVLPPATSVGAACSTPSANNYNLSNAAYTVVPLSRGYTDKGGKLITSHPLVTTINCIKGAGSTSYANAVEAAQAELDKTGRPDVQDVIVFFSDGAANTGPTYYPTTSPYRKQPCHQGVTSAGYSKAKGTLMYVIGYDLDANNGGANKCTSYTGQDESPAITAYQALSQMASDPKKFYEKTSPGDLTNIFEDISGDLMYGSSALIDNNAT